MKSLRSFKPAFTLLALLCALFSANFARAQFGFIVDINTASLVGKPGSPFSLDFQAIYGSGGPQTILLSNFVVTGGSFVGPATSIGNVSGSLASTLTLNPTSGSFFNEFFQEFSTGVTDIRFMVSPTTGPAAGTPTAFSIAILDSSLLNIPTTGLGDSLLMINLDGRSSNLQTGVSTGATAGVTAVAVAVPEPSTYGAIAGLALVGIVAWRRRRI